MLSAIQMQNDDITWFKIGKNKCSLQPQTRKAEEEKNTKA